jgi:cytoskeleton-associated protein 5
LWLENFRNIYSFSFKMLGANFNKSLVGMMFHADFKQHLRALDMLIPFAEADIDALVSNLDLLLKWMTLRFFETNPSVNIKGLEYLALVFQLLAERNGDVALHDIEANSFIPFLVLKIGDPKDQIRNSCRTILKHLCKLYPASKLFVFLMNGLATKNAKQRAECLEEMGALIRVSGLGVCGAQPAVALRELAKQIADRDNAVRSAALNAVTEAYFQEGERLYKMIGNLPEKDMAMLEERIKRLVQVYRN